MSGAQMMDQGQLVFLVTALAACRSLLSGAVLMVWIRHWCSKPWDRCGFSGTPPEASCPGDICRVQTCCNHTWKGRLLSVALFRLSLHIFPLICSTEINHIKSVLGIYAGCQGGRWSAIWYLGRHLYMKYAKPVRKRAVLIFFWSNSALSCTRGM